MEGPVSEEGQGWKGIPASDLDLRGKLDQKNGI